MWHAGIFLQTAKTAAQIQANQPAARMTTRRHRGGIRPTTHDASKRLTAKPNYAK
jgi:hypothetical protein